MPAVHGGLPGVRAATGGTDSRPEGLTLSFRLRRENKANRGPQARLDPQDQW